ncbi:hypothetical protein [Streptomyces sp. GESEQ-35]|uniref:hypothetical protein n=1 Tax=Streptomyces sp. GESEQ-35 TaxID=2812657 RepID=UPI001B339A79|nr:hypothetical protein [Streptomyces sp. GESEQ-35]
MRGLTIRMPRGRRGRVTAGVGCLLTAVLIALLPLPAGADQAQAAAADDSSVTKSGAKGKYDDFSGLKVTVHQTEGLRGQGVRVTWTGGKPAPEKAQNFLQIMQCWGDDAQAGPSRTQCEYGADANAQPGGLRSVDPTTDPLETDHATVPGVGPYVPFRPVEGPETTSSRDFTYFTPGDTNALPWLPNDGNGGGEAVFEVKSSLESPHLGCGARTTSAKEIRPCWLVVVPRGEHETNGNSGSNLPLTTSALSQTNWNQRIVFRLGFEPVTDSCDPDKPERGIEGSELATDAITSWQSELCRTGTHRFTFTQSSELHGREVATAPSDTTGLGLTVDPVPAAAGGANVVQAPVAVSGLTVGFVWMYDHLEGGAYQKLPLKEVKLNQRLLAKVLTQSYPYSLAQPVDGIPEYLTGNPWSIGMDPEFQRINPGLEDLARVLNLSPLGLVVPSDNSDSARLMWEYILADRDAREFVEGKKDPWGMTVNPEYKDGVISDSLDFFPKADLTPTTLKCNGDGGTFDRTGQDVVPYATDFHEGALKIRRGDIGAAVECNTTNRVTKMTLLGRPASTEQRAFGVVDNASAVRYRLGTAALPNADGEYIKPNDASLLKAVAQMPGSDVAGVKATDPAKMKDGAYPLAAVVYAAASVDQAKDVRQDYADVIRYAAGKGQTPGTAKGQLPYGYAPLPTAMRQQAQQAADRLEKGVPNSPESPDADAPGPGDDLDGGGGGTTGGLDGGTDSGGLTGGDSAGAAAGGTDAGAGGAGTSPPGASETDPAKQNVAQSGGLTPSEVLGLIRWVLLGVLIAGGVAALAGPVMLRLSARRAAGGG